MPRKAMQWEIEYLRPNGEIFTMKVGARTIDKAIEKFRLATSSWDGAEILRVERWK